MEHYLLLGLGKSNLAVAFDLMKKNISFDVFLDTGDITEDIRSYGSTLYQNLNDIVWDKYNSLIKSPGIPFSHPVMVQCKKMKITVTNEIGYSLQYIKKPVIAITGTNGKTTTTSLVEHILNIKTQNSKAVGNIGHSFLETAKEQDKILVAELSSFQLRDLSNFHPEISIWLNMHSAHLDYHKTIEDYIASKKNILINQKNEDLCIFNEDDMHIKRAAQSKVGYKKSFSFINCKANAFFDGEYIWIEGDRFIRKQEIGIKGTHNIQNAMAAILATLELTSKEDIINALKTFRGVEHRLEVVIDNDTLKVYNDSKSTNITAVKAALSAFDNQVILMMGGLDRGNGYKELNQDWGSVKTVICFGESGEKIYESAKKYTEAILENDLEKAIVIAKEKVASGGTLLFSPGCASWDQFSSFEERGHFFKERFL